MMCYEYISNPNAIILAVTAANQDLGASFLEFVADNEQNLALLRLELSAELCSEAPNYDPVHKIIRSMENGSRGPMLRKATALDWVGDPFDVTGFRALHGERNGKAGDGPSATKC